MLIEASSFRLCLDLIQSLDNAGFEATEIRLNFKGSKRFFEDKKSLSSSVRYAGIMPLKSEYIKKYNQIAITGKNPFTINKGNSFNYDTIPSAKGGIILQKMPTPSMGSDGIPNIFKLGKYAVIRGIKLSSKKLGFPTSYNCINTHKDNFKVVKNTSFRSKRNLQRINATAKSETTIKSIITKYRLIHDKFFNLYLENKDKNLEYIDFVGDGPTGKTYKLYEMHFPIIKRPINSGLTDDILKTKYLLRQG